MGDNCAYPWLVVSNAREPVNVGLPLGAMVPEFSALDQDGKTQSLATIRGPKGTLLVFLRSVDWCPFSKAQVLEIERNLDNVHAQGLGDAAIVVDDPGSVRDFTNRNRIRFPLLSDPDSRVIREFGVLNATVPKDTAVYGVPHPGIVLIDASGRVKKKYFEKDFKQYYTVAGILVERYGMQPVACKPYSSLASL